MTDEIIQVGKWAVALERRGEGTMLRFDFSDTTPLTFLIPKDDAQKIAEAILSQYKNAPATKLN